MQNLFPNCLFQFDDWSISNFYDMQILQIVLLSFITFLSHLNIISTWFFKDVLLFGKASWYLSNLFLTFLVISFIVSILYYVFTWIPHTETQKLTLFCMHFYNPFQYMVIFTDISVLTKKSQTVWDWEHHSSQPTTFASLAYLKPFLALCGCLERASESIYQQPSLCLTFHLVWLIGKSKIPCQMVWAWISGPWWTRFVTFGTSFIWASILHL